MMKLLIGILLLQFQTHLISGFSIHQRPHVSSSFLSCSSSSSSSDASTNGSIIGSTSTSSSSTIALAVAKLKNVLEREYVSFFDPMRTEYYAPAVTFDDPLTSLQGVQAYQQNVDMLAGRTLLGSILFQDGSIQLHSITGGHIINNNTTTTAPTISDIVTRWTLRFTMKIWPWKPTARFSGISIYKLKLNTDDTKNSNELPLQIVGQTDYWDSINLQPGGSYQKVSKIEAFKDFIDQLKPGGFQAKAAAPELPYSLLRRAKDYQVRRYPAFTSVSSKYGRRDEGFGSLGAFTKSTESPLGPAILTVNADSDNKSMQWPLTYAPPSAGRDDDTAPPEPIKAIQKASTEAQWRKCTIQTTPSRIVAVAEFSDVSMEPVVRRADALLRKALQRDGLVPLKEQDGSVQFAQYDAIFSMGKRRSEVWIELSGNDNGENNDERMW